MSEHNDLGKLGEMLATEHLINKGYQILAKNYVYEKAEIDIIAEYLGTTVFIEVKTRKNKNSGSPEEAVGRTKQKLLTKAAGAYIMGHDVLGEVRFDIISIIFNNTIPEVFHIEDAFFLNE